MAAVDGYLFDRAAKIAAEVDLPWAELDGKTVLVTGSTGLIGSQIVRTLLSRNDRVDAGINVVLPVRNTKKAQALFGDRSDVSVLEWSLGDELVGSEHVDYVAHAACGTSSKSFLETPATTIMQIVHGGEAVLRYACSVDAKKVLFLSTMEVYGEVEGVATEDNLGKLDPMVVRNSYPEAKRLVECLCASYATEHGVPSVVMRLAQTFGEGVHPDDMRVFADFGRHAIEGKDIVLLSDGLKRNGYLSVDDSVRAILIALVKGKPGEAYNAVNEDAYCSIREMAQLVLDQFGAEGAQVRREFDPEREATFRKASDLMLDSSKLKALGWKPYDSLSDMYRAMIDCWSVHD
ncbi:MULTISPECIES: NAD-dependent epimerase/dehydratase family protein [unclassified Collinsella]|uniref:NAD-dependent epimerase/dehydratase family protein n=1 Tax=unclassified Collinsella TaxID=2637548 RepID=UPI003F928C33